ncbi:MAG: hypothetical protein ACOVQI_08120 [Tagaea sp.]
MTAIHRATSVLIWTVAAAAVVFLLAPLVVTVLVAFSASAVFALPPPEWSLRWFERLPNTRGLWPALSTSVERLSSGLRINRAKDDAAGLGISEKIKSQVTSLNQGLRNANDAISMVQTAEGSLSEVS